MKQRLILSVSNRMDKNKKGDRREDGLIRIGEKARKNLGLSKEKTVELWPSTSTEERINKSRTLEIFMAYDSDLTELKQHASEDEFMRTGFVTQKIFDAICGKKNDAKNMWISEDIEDTVIGGDPEFILLEEDGEVEYAGHVGGFGADGQLGSDGPLAEIRPNPAIEVEEFVNNITLIFKKHPRVKIIKDYLWKSGCCWITPDHYNRQTWPIGGHIHIGTPKVIARKFDKEDENLFKRSMFVVMTKILDELLAIPMMKIDGKKESVERRKHYGAFGDFRSDRDRLEYRGLSGSWLAHPKLAMLVLGTAKAITDSFFHMLEDQKFNIKYINEGFDPFRTNVFDPRCLAWDRVEIAKDMGAKRSAGEMVAILNRYDFEFSKANIALMKNILRSLVSYERYCKYIDGFMEVVSMPQESINEIGNDLKENWLDGKDFII